MRPSAPVDARIGSPRAANPSCWKARRAMCRLSDGTSTRRRIMSARIDASADSVGLVLSATAAPTASATSEATTMKSNG